ISVISVVPAEVPIVPADPLVAPEVGAAFFILPTRVLDLVDYSSSSYSDPSEDSLPPAPKRHESLTVHDALVLRWRDKVASRPSSLLRSSPHDTLAPSFEFPLAPVVAPPGICRRPTILVRPGEAIPFGRPYRTHPNRSPKLLTVRKRVGLFPTRRLGWRHISHRSSDRHSLPDSTSDPSYSSSSRILHQIFLQVGLPSVMTLQYSEVFRRWRSTPLSTPYPLTTSESSLDSSSGRLLDSSSPSIRPSRKRYRSPTTLVPSPTPISRLIAPTHADLLPPCKRFRDSYSPTDSREEHTKIGTIDAEAIADLGISDGVGAHTEDAIVMGVKVVASDIREDEEKFEAEASAGGTMEIVVDPLVIGGIFESIRGDPLILRRERKRASLADRVRRLGRENLRIRALLCIERDYVDGLHHHMALSQEEFRQIHRDRDDTQRRLRRLGWRHISHRSSDRHSLPDSTSDLSYSSSSRILHQIFLQVGLPSVMTLQYSEVFRRWRSTPLSTPYPLTTSESSLDSSSGRLLDSSSPSIRPSRKRYRSPTTLVPSPTPISRLIAPTHADLLPPCKRFRDSYSPTDSREEHTKIGTIDAEAIAYLGISDGVGAHTEDAIVMGVKVVASDIREDEEKFEAEASAGGTMEIVVDPLVIGGIFESIRGDPLILRRERKRASLADRVRRLGRENLRIRALLCIERDYVDGLHHHMALSQEEFRQIHRDRDDTQRRLRRMTPAAIEEMINRRVEKALETHKANKNIGLGNCGGDANLDFNVITDTFILNNHYASVLFDSGADRSFMSTTFSTLLDIIPDTLDVSYDVDLADERISKTNTVLRGCTLGLLGHPFDINLIPVELGSFDFIIDMDWLANHYAVIVCDKKIVRIPYRDEFLIV
nr:reverse transcriptase domain-containing protein [Tanacetum cinerariifolium]